ncbi:MAG TPA: shikimate dehydrogenase [Pseudolabrys sp.]|nr:shikimate dehydrogenase [Pseudolabrys sp.]
MPVVRLGLIGDNIAASQAPLLHKLAGRLCGLSLAYDLLQPAELGLAFEEVLRQCQRSGYRGLNITYPYKERVVAYLEIDDPVVRAIGACNTVLFQGARARGYNSDYTGFLAAYRNCFGDAPPGCVALAGAGGVGRAIAFALVRLGAGELRLFDVEIQKSVALAETMRAVLRHARIEIAGTIEQAAEGADALVNATPVGMAGVGGCLFQPGLMDARRWAFDAVYTPVDTPFMLAARAAGLSTMSGYELFLYQGIDAFRHFTGRDVAERPLRELLKSGGR